MPTFSRKNRSRRNLPSAISVFQVAVGRRQQPDVDLDRVVGADAVNLAVLQHAEQLRLQRQRHVADFVEEQRAAVGVLESALAEPVGPGECPGFVAEQFVVEQVLVQGGAVHGHERLGPPRAVGVQRLGGEFLAGAALAEDQDGRPGRGVRLEPGDHVVHPRAIADHALEAELLVELSAEVAVGPGELPPLAGLLDDGPHLGHVERLLQVVQRPELHRLDGRLHVAEAGHDHDLGVRLLRPGLANDGQAVDVAHPQVGEDDVELVAVDGGGTRPCRTWRPSTGRRLFRALRQASRHGI